MLYKMRKKEVFFVNEAQFFAPWRVVAEFADDSRLTFDGFTEEQARAAMTAHWTKTVFRSVCRTRSAST